MVIIIIIIIIIVLYKFVFRQMYTLYFLLFNTVCIKNNPTCFEPCHSLSSGTQLFITPAIYIWYSLKYISWVDKMPLTVLGLWSLYQLLHGHHLFVSGIPRFYIIKKMYGPNNIKKGVVCCNKHCKIILLHGTWMIFNSFRSYVVWSG
jgi:hypothetical protein